MTLFLDLDDEGLPRGSNSYFFTRVQPLQKRRKTRVYSINSRSRRMSLGLITWHGAWRQYVFAPNEKTIWSQDCLEDVRTFIKHLMNLRQTDPSLRKRQ